MSKMKKVLGLMMALSLTVSAFAVTPKTVEAASVKYNIQNVTDLGTGKTVTKTWTNKDHKEVYYSFKLKKNGYTSFSVTKPSVDGLVSEERVAILDSKGKEVWVSYTQKLDKNGATKDSYKVGLKKGKYYLCVQPQYMSVMSWQSATTKVSLSTKAATNFETESNNSKKKANTLKLGKAVKGTFCEEYDCVKGTTGDDWYKVKVKKGTKYKVTLKNNKKLKKNDRTTLVYILNDKQKSEYKYGYNLMKKGTVTFKATKSGYYYIRLWNDGQHSTTDYQLKVEKKK